MFRTIENLNKLRFPLYKIPSDNWDILDGIVFVDGKVVDDLNRPGESIGLRRLQTGRPKKELIKLNNPYFLLSDVITSRQKNFISSCGKPFTYVKTGFQHIKYHRIKRFDPREIFTFVWLEGITIPLEIARPPSDLSEVVWARVLYYKGFPWMIYDFKLYPGPHSRIKV